MSPIATHEGLSWEYGAPAPSAAVPAAVTALRGLFIAFLLSIPVETLLYFQSDPNNPDSGVTLSRILGTVLLAAGAAQWRVCFKRLPLAFWMIAWYLAAYLTTRLWIPAALMPQFDHEFLTLAQMAALFLVSVNLLGDGPFRRRAFRLYGWWMVGVALLLVLGVFGVQTEEGRASISTQDPNVTAALLTAGALCLAGDEKLLARGREPWRVLLTLAGVAVIGVAVLQTGSRGGLIAFGVGFGALGLCAGAKTRAARLFITLGALTITGGLVAREFAAGSTTAARLQRSWDEGDTAGRTDIYDEAWRMVHERPLLGYGGANNRFVLGARLNYPERDTHNIFLAALTEVGFIGALGFFGALLYGLVNGWRGGKRSGDALPLALLCSMLVTGTAITATKEKLFWVILAAAVASGLRSSRRREEERPA